MAEGEKKVEAESAIELQGVDERHPWFMRLFAVLCVLGGFDGAVSFIWSLVEFIRHDQLATVVKDHTGATIVIAAIALVLAFAASIMFFVLGICLLRGNRRRAALLASFMISVAAVIMVCQFMIFGLNIRLLPAFIAMLILVAVESYADPALREERQLQRQLQKMENRQAAEDGTLGRDTTGKGYIELNFFNLFWIFVVVCIAGLIIEVFWHMTMIDPLAYQDRAGLLYGPFSPIYGVGAVLMTIALNRFHDKNAFIIFLVSGVIGAAFEFFVSWFMETAFGIVAWDYSGTFLNIDGRTNFMFLCIWGALGIIWVKIAMPMLLKLVNFIPWNWRYSVTVVCAVLMLADCVLTLAAFDCWYQREAGTMDYEHASAITQFCNENFDDEFMANRFQSMTMDPGTASRVN